MKLYESWSHCRSGKVKIGFNFVILNDSNDRYISYLNYVNVLLDEIVNKSYINQVMTTVSEK